MTRPKIAWKHLRVFVTLMIIGVMALSQTAFALPEEDYMCIDNDCANYVLDNGKSCAIPDSSASGAPPTSPDDQGTGKIYVIGDSLTVGMRDSGELKQKLEASEWQVVDIPAIEGKPLQYGIDQMSADSAKLAGSDAVLVGLGTNNIGSVVKVDGSTTILPTGVETIKAQMQKIVDIAKAANPKIRIYWTDFYGKGVLTTRFGAFNLDAAYSDALNPTLKEIAQINNVAVLPWSTSEVAQKYVPNNDVHPNGQYPAMADLIVNSLKGAKVPAVTSGSNCSCGGTTLTGSQNAEKVWNYLIGKEEFRNKPLQVAALMGNLQAESGFEPGINEKNPIVKGSRGGFGLAQWTGGRRVALEKAAANTGPNGVDVADLGFQLDFLWSELTGAYKDSVLTPLLAASAMRQASDIVLIRFEAPAAKNDPKVQADRAKLGDAILAKYGSSTGASSGSTVCSGANGEAVNGFSLPLDKKWYNEHKEWFTKPHHDYPASDIPIPTGTKVYAIADGTIADVTEAESKCGSGLLINAANGVSYSYCHGLDAGTLPGARAGDKVTAGQHIMNSDNTGNSTGPHLHVGIKVNGENRCPQSLFVSIVEGSPIDPTTLPGSGCVKGTIGDVRSNPV